MAGRRGARSGRGWDAIPPRSADEMTSERPPEGELRRDDAERGNVPARRRRSSPGAGSADESSPRPAGRGRGSGVWAGVPSVGGSGTASSGSFRGRRSKSSAGGRSAADGGISAPDGSPSDGPRSSSGGGWGRSGQPPQSEPERAREICLRQLAVRPRTRVELAKALAAKEISDEVIA